MGCNCSPLLPILIVTPRACPHHYLVAMSPPSIEENQRDTTILMFLTICHLTQIYSKCWYVRLLSRWETCITESFAKTRKSSIVYGYIKFKEIVCWPNYRYYLHQNMNFSHKLLSILGKKIYNHKSDFSSYRYIKLSF